MRLSWLAPIGLFGLSSACADVAPAVYDAGKLTPPLTFDASAPDAARPDAGPPPMMLPDGGTLAPLPSTAATWLGQVIYLVIPDRFYDGDPANDSAATPACFDPREPERHPRRRLRRPAPKIPYLQDLGVTALWITPGYLESKDRCGYHGYWADFTDPDDGAVDPERSAPWPTSPLSPPSLHAAGMKLILDMVVNHAGIAARASSISTRPGSTTPPPAPPWATPPSTAPSAASRSPTSPRRSRHVAAYLTATAVGWANAPASTPSAWTP